MNMDAHMHMCIHAFMRICVSVYLWICIHVYIYRYIYQPKPSSRHGLCSCTRQHTAAHCNTLQHTATYYNTLQHTATHCNTLQHTATHCNTQDTETHCNRLQQTATDCNTNSSKHGLRSKHLPVATTIIWISQTTMSKHHEITAHAMLEKKSVHTRERESERESEREHTNSKI